MGSTDPQTSRDHNVGAYRDGIEAICQIAGGLHGRDWHKAACGDWSAQEVARHLLAVVEWHHHWLDRAIAGEFDSPFPIDELEDRNELEVHNRRGLTGHEAVVMFNQSANAYLQRISDQPNLRERNIGTPGGPRTVEQHLASSAAEWHLHAWDLGHTVGVEHAVPSLHRLDLSHETGASERAQARPLLKRLAAKIASRRSSAESWNDLLVASGRHV